MPEGYVKYVHKVRNLPSNIRFRKNKFVVEFKRKRKYVYGGQFDTKELAEEEVNKRLKQEKEEKEKEFSSRPITRNEKGIAVIKAYNDGKLVDVKVDDNDYIKYNLVSWNISKDGYVRCTKGLLHRLIMNAKPGSFVDHIDRDKTNNMKSNLRELDRNDSTHIHNQNKKSNTTSKYKGVTKRSNGMFDMSIMKGGIRHQATFKDEEEAAKAYDKKSKELYGQHGYQNFPMVIPNTNDN